MIRKLTATLAATGIALALVACTAVQSFDQRLAAAYTTNTSVRTTTAAALNAEQISSADAERVLEITDQARAILDDASDGDERGLALAIEILQGVERGLP